MLYIRDRVLASLLCGACVSQASAALIIDLSVNGHKYVPVTQTGEIEIQLSAVVSGTNGIADEGFQSLTGSLLSTNPGGAGRAAALGSISFAAAGSFTERGVGGTQADLDGDGDLDIGTNATNTQNAPPHFSAGANQLQWGVVADNSPIHLGTIAFNVNNLGTPSADEERVTQVTYRKVLSSIGNLTSISGRHDNTSLTGTTAGTVISPVTFYRPWATIDIDPLPSSWAFGEDLVVSGRTQTSQYAQYGGGEFKVEFKLTNGTDTFDLFRGDSVNTVIPWAEVERLQVTPGEYYVVATVTGADGFTSEAFQTSTTINVVPEPATLGLAGLALAAAGRRRRARMN